MINRVSVALQVGFMQIVSGMRTSYRVRWPAKAATYMQVRLVLAAMFSVASRRVVMRCADACPL